MKLLFVADGRSPIALNWITHLAQGPDEVHVVSTFPCPDVAGVESMHTVPVAFSGAGGAGKTSPGGTRAIKLRSTIRHWAGPLTIPAAAGKLKTLLDDIRPDLVHAMRIPYEGMLATAADPAAPLLVSIWGNDFTLHAPASPLMRRWTALALQRADALQTDCWRDLRLAHALGFPDGRPELVVPGNGGIRPEIFHPAEGDEPHTGRVAALLASIPVDAPVIVNPRGFRAYVRNDTFFRSIPLVREFCPEAFFVCPSMAGISEAEAWVQRSGAGSSIVLLPRLTPQEMAQVYSRALITISVSEHDGTPNTLLEAMACDCYPIAGDLDSIREWIEDGVNGSLVRADSPEDLAGAVIAALRNDDVRQQALKHNRLLIQERAAQPEVMKTIRAFYTDMLDRTGA